MQYWSLAQMSNEERENILSQHKELYNGYQTLQPTVSNTQPLYVQDFAKDKLGANLNNDGSVKPYTNYRINESHVMDTCEQCGGTMNEGECSECGWGGQMEETKEGYKTGKLDDIYDEEDLAPSGDFDYVEGGGNDYGTFEKMHHMKGIKTEATATSNAPMSLGKHYDEIEAPYDFKSNGPVGNGGTLRQKNVNEEGKQTNIDELGIGDLKKGKKYKYVSPSFEDEIEFEDEFEDKSGGENMFKFKGKKSAHLLPGKGIERFVDTVDEGSYTGGGNAPDFERNIDPAYDFETDGPIEDTYTEPADDMDLEQSKVERPFDFVSGGPDNGGDAYPMNEDGECNECWEKMESAWAEEVDEQDVSGVQGIYGAAEKPYAFVSSGPGKAGPYQTHSWGGEELSQNVDEEYEGEDEDAYWQEDLEPNELELDLTKFNPEDKSWEEITAYTGEDEFAHLGEEKRENLEKQRQKILEMFERFKTFH